MRLLLLFFAALLGCAPRVTLDRTQSFAIQLQKIDLKALGESRFDIVVIDSESLSPEKIESLKVHRWVLSYLSIGEAEDYRPYWRKEEWKDRPPAWLGPENPAWPGNYKVRYWDPEWQKIAFEWLDRIVAQGADGAYLDVIDAYEFWEKDVPDAKARMIEFVERLSRRAKEANPRFLIFPQNCERLVEDAGYLAAIDGIGREETYFIEGRRNGEAEIRASERWLDRAVASGKKVVLIEYLVERESIDWFLARSRSKGYLPCVATRALDRLP